MPLPPANTPLAKKYDLGVMGDSLSNSYLYGVYVDQCWPAVAAGFLQKQGALIKARNFARSGNTTGTYYTTAQAAANADMIARFGWMTAFKTPDIAVLWGGVNDIGNGTIATGSSSRLWNSTTAPTKGAWTTDTVAAASVTSTAVTVPTGHGANYNANQYLIIGSGAFLQYAVISSISTDTLNLATSIIPPASGTIQVSQGTRANLCYMIQSLINAGCTKIVVPNTHFINFAGGSASAGDQYSGTYPSGTLTPQAAYAALRPYQAAAVTSGFGSGWTGATVVLCDLYTYFERLVGNDPALKLTNGVSVSSGPYDIQGNTVVYQNATYIINANADSTPQFGTNTQSYHVYNAGNNGIHQNALGHWLCAQFITNTILSQSGWLTAVSS